MATKPITNESIALTEKKMEMTLDDIIKMSKKTTNTKGKRPVRVPNKSRGFTKGGPSQQNSFKVQNFLDSRSSIRQGVLARRRTNNQGNQFPLTTEAARKAAAAPIRNRANNWNRTRSAQYQKAAPGNNTVGKDKMAPKQRQTLDARFADIVEQRKNVASQQIAPRGSVGRAGSRGRGRQQQRQMPGRSGGFPVGPARQTGNFRR